MALIYSAIVPDRRVDPATVASLGRRFARKRIIGTVAALVGHKDLPTLLRAARRVQDQRRDVQFVVLGEGPLQPVLEKQMAESGLDNLILEGFQQDPDSYYGIFDVFALTSNEEGLGSAILDAFAHRIPVVATAGGGIPELVRNGETGVLCPVGDDAAVAQAILHLLDDSALSDRLAAGAHAHLEKEFTVSRMAERYEQVYRELAQ